MTDTASPSGLTYHMPGEFEFVDSDFFTVSAYPMGGGPDLANAMQPDCEADRPTPLQTDADIETEAEARREMESETQSETHAHTAPQQSAEGLLLKHSLGFCSNNPYSVSFPDDFDDNAMPDDLQEQQTDEYTNTTPQTAMAATLDFSVFRPLHFGRINDDNNDNNTAGRPSISLSSRTRTSNASSTATTTTATTATVAAPTPYDYSIFPGSYTSLLSADSDSISDTGSDEAVEDSDDSDLPSPSLFRNKDGSLGAEGLADITATKEIDDAVRWADVAVPAALLETLVLTGIDTETAPHLLYAVLQASVENIQSQVPIFKEAVSLLKDGRAQQQRQEEEEEKLQETEKEAKGKGKGKQVEAMAESTATLRPSPLVTTTTAAAQTSAQPRKSKRQMLASKLKRLRGSSSAGNGESSSQGAAAAAAAAAAMQRHSLSKVVGSSVPGFQWAQNERSQQWELVPEDDAAVLGSAAVAIRTEAGMAPNSLSRRKTMLLDMVTQKEAVPPQTMQVHLLLR